MALVLRNVSVYGGQLACSSGAASRVWCGVESTRLLKSNAGFSQSADLPARCQASIAIYPLATRQAHVGVLERPLETTRTAPETRPATIDQPAESLPRSFLAESVTGQLVECTGRGSRPLYTSVLAEFQLNYTGTSASASATDNVAVKKAFDAALHSAPGDVQLLSEFAMFTWKSLGDVDAAEEIYNKALELAPDDPHIQASHALFLWQCDD